MQAKAVADVAAKKSQPKSNPFAVRILPHAFLLRFLGTTDPDAFCQLSGNTQNLLGFLKAFCCYARVHLSQTSSSQSSGTSPASDDVGAGTTTLGGGTAGSAVTAVVITPRVPTPSSPLPDG